MLEQRTLQRGIVRLYPGSLKLRQRLVTFDRGATPPSNRLFVIRYASS